MFEHITEQTMNQYVAKGEIVCVTFHQRHPRSLGGGEEIPNMSDQVVAVGTAILEEPMWSISISAETADAWLRIWLEQPMGPTWPVSTVWLLLTM